MVYLLTQMFFALGLAALFGGAVGWLLHRHRAGNDRKELQRIIHRQHVQMEQARSEVAMMADDFADLQEQSRQEVGALQQENRRIPALENNLEKSQLMVRQMIQKHEVQLAELTRERDQLNVQLKEKKDFERTAEELRLALGEERLQHRQLQARLSQTETTDNSDPEERDTKAEASTNETESTVEDEQPTAEPTAHASDTPRIHGDETSEDETESLFDEVVEIDGALQADLHGELSPGSEATTATTEAVNHDSTNSVQTAKPTRSERFSATQLTAANDTSVLRVDSAISDDGKTEKTIDDLLLDIEDESEDKDRYSFDIAGNIGDIDEDGTVLLDPTELSLRENDEEANHLDEFPELDRSRELAFDEFDSPHPDHPSRSVFDNSGFADPQDELGLRETIEEGIDKQAVEEKESVRQEARALRKEAEALLEDDTTDLTDLDESSSLTRPRYDTDWLFEPVTRRDDLTRIFGIGPVTEKELNRLGITSYSQLADLKQHDIETIAGALKIVPGKIKREDWAGNARRELESVLEDL